MQLVSLIPADSAFVVEFGCADGSTGRLFKQIQPDCCYLGIENSADLAHQAARVLDQVRLENFSDFDFFRQGILPETVDCLLYHGEYSGNNCLAEKLKEQSSFLRAKGQVLFDLPNSRYFKNICALWQGEAALYPSVQPLKQVLAAFKAAGLQVYDIQPYYSREDEELKNKPEVKKLVEAFLSCGLLPEKEPVPDLWAVGYVLRAVKGEVAKPMLVQTMIGEEKVCARVRVVEPQSFLQTIPGVRSVHSLHAADLALAYQYPRKIFIRQRIWSELPKAKAELKMLLEKGYLLISEIDDDPLRWREFHEREQFFSFRACHAVQTSTPALAEYLRQFNPEVAVFANQMISLPVQRVYDAKTPVTLFFGALNREADWAELMPVLNLILAKYGNGVQVKVIHDREFFDALETDRKEFVPFCPYPVYAEILHTADIAILPLQNTRFNRMKSDLKFIECAAHGAVVLASPTVYAQSLHPGSTGLLYQNAAEFSKLLQELIENAPLRWELAENAYAYVKRERLLSRHYQDRYAWYEKLWGNLPELNRALLKRIEKL